MAERNDISGLLAFIGREGDWRARLQELVAEHLMPALEEFGIHHEGLTNLLYDHGSCFLAEDFQKQIKAWGITPRYAFVGEPATNGVVERSFRTLLEPDLKLVE